MYTYLYFNRHIIIHRTYQSLETLALANVLSRAINYVNYIFGHEYYMTIKVPAKALDDSVRENYYRDLESS